HRRGRSPPHRSRQPRGEARGAPGRMPGAREEDPRRGPGRRAADHRRGQPRARRRPPAGTRDRGRGIRQDRLDGRHEGGHRRLPREARAEIHGQVRLVDFKALPKIDLHRHLEGCVRFDTLVELAREVKIDLPRAELRRRTTMDGEKPGFLRFMSKFELYRGLYPSREWIERVAFEAVEDAKKDGVIYLELRFSPTHFGRRMGAKGEDVAEWVARGARRAKIPVTFIATYGRHFSVMENEPTTRAVRGTNLFSAVDLAGVES